MNIYITADVVGVQTGGGLVTHHEWEAMKTLTGKYLLYERNNIGHPPAYYQVGDDAEPWGSDNWLSCNSYGCKLKEAKLAHVYAGTFTKTVQLLQANGCKVTYTAAAHDIAASRREHLALGLPYDYPHLNDPALWERYLGGYKQADCIVCPSQHSADVMRGFGCKNKIVVIPHGCEIPDAIKPLPETFTVGYLGAYGPDKGVRYLLEAWKKLNYPKEEARLILAGRGTESKFVRELAAAVYGGADKVFWQGGCFGEQPLHWSTLDGKAKIYTLGWVQDVSDFYSWLSLYVQPSVTEGFGCEVLEAQSHNRAVLCSVGAGAADTVPEWYKFKAGDADELASKIAQVRLRGCCQGVGYPNWREDAKKYEWKLIRQKYVELWNDVLRG